MSSISTGMGQQVNGTLTQYAAFPESCLVHAPKKLSFEQAATLTCSGLTAWNACMGLKGREVKKGDWVLVQGSGGVSIASLQVSLQFLILGLSRAANPTTCPERVMAKRHLMLMSLHAGSNDGPSHYK